MAQQVPVAYEEQNHQACEDSCSCGGLSGYVSQTKDALRTLGSPDANADVAKRKDYIVRARSAGLSPASAANMIYALDHGFSMAMMYPDRDGARETAMANDYEAVDNRGKRVFGPTKDYGEAKLHAERSGGVVKFVVGASEADPKKLAAAPDAVKRVVANAQRSANGLSPHLAKRAVHLEHERDGGEEVWRVVDNFERYSDTMLEYVGDRWFTRRMSGSARTPISQAEAEANALLMFTDARASEHVVTYKVKGEQRSRAFPMEAQAEAFADGLRHSGHKVVKVEAREARAEDYSSFAGALRAARAQGWTHASVTEMMGGQNSAELFKRFGNAGWTSAGLYYKEGKWHIGGASTEAMFSALPADVTPIEAQVETFAELAAINKLYTERRKGAFDGKLRFHRHKRRKNAYAAEAGALGQIVVAQRSPDRRHGQLPWFAMVQTVEIAQADTKTDLYRACEQWAKNPSASAAGAAEVTLRPQGDVDVIERTPSSAPSGVRVDSPKRVHAIMRDRVARLGHEEFYVIGVSKQGEMVGQPVQVAMGQVDHVSVDVAAVVAAAAMLRSNGAVSVWVCHNHPSGYGNNASDADKDLTKRIRKGMDAIGMDFNGHLVLSDKHVSRA